jgi:thymidylate kinase
MKKGLFISFEGGEGVGKSHSTLIFVLLNSSGETIFVNGF